MPEELAEPDEVAQYLGVPDGTLRQWRYLGTGPKYIKVGRHIRYRWSDVAVWLDSQTRAATR